MAQSGSDKSGSDKSESDQSGGRGIPDGLKDAIEGAFAATGRTRAQAQDLTEKTRSRAQGLVDEVRERGSEARGTLDGMRLVSRDEFRELENRIDEISSRLAEIEAKTKAQPEG